MTKVILPITIILFLIAGVLVWPHVDKTSLMKSFKIRTNTELPISLPITVTPTTAETLDEGEGPLIYVNPSVTIDAFETAIPAKKYSDLSEFMTPTVTLIKYGTSCCGVVSKAKAIAEMAYLSGGVAPWNFEDQNPIAAKLATADPENFKEVFVGTASNYYTVGLDLNDEFLIDRIVITNDYHLIIGN